MEPSSPANRPSFQSSNLPSRHSPALRAAICLGTVESRAALPTLTPADIRRRLLDPIWPDGSRRTVFDIVLPGESVCCVVSDQTRKTAADIVLPVLLDGLADKGCRPEDLFFLFATGIHRHPAPAEVERILGPEIARQFSGRVFCHDPDNNADLVAVGTSRHGQTVRVNRRAVEAERLILFGAATYHYHAGFGGGRKSLVPGLASRDTIAHNHSLTLDPSKDRLRPGVEIGRLDGNPVAEEMLESARLCDPDIVVNTVLDPSGRLIGVFSGELDAAHRAACGLVERVCRADIGELADFVVADAGYARNWVQSHKALFNASRAIKPGGRVILVAPCPEGLGDERFRYWIRKPSIRDIFRELRERVEVLGQTALSTKSRGAAAVLVTGMPSADAADLGIETAPDIDTAVRRVIEEFVRRGSPHPTYYLIPHAKDVTPFLFLVGS